MNDNADTMNDTKTKSIKGKWNNITKRWARNCPKCGKELSYSQKCSMLCAEREGWCCAHCSNSGENNGMFGKHHSLKTRKKIGCKSKRRMPWNKGKIGVYSKDVLSKMGAQNKGRVPWNKGIPAPHKGIIPNELSRRKMRLSRIRYLKSLHGQTHPNFNPIGCQRIDEYGKQNGFDFQHAMNNEEFYIKELGYWVDGYDKMKNIVIEYYEHHHQNPRQMLRDKRRKQEILNHLHCTFIEMWEDGTITITKYRRTL